MAAIAAVSSSSEKPFTFGVFDGLDLPLFCFLLLNEASCLARSERSLRDRSIEYMQSQKQTAPIWQAIAINRASFERITTMVKDHKLRRMLPGTFEWFRPEELGISWKPHPHDKHLFTETSRIGVQKKSEEIANIFVVIKHLEYASPAKLFYLCYDLNNKKIVVMSRIPLTTKIGHSKVGLADEVQRTDALAARWWGCLPSFESMNSSNSYYAVAPWSSEGDLIDYLAKCPHRDFVRRLRMARDMAYCLLPVHQAGCVHGDIKPDNFLLFTQDTLIPRLIDFVTCCLHGTKKNELGTISFFAPEMCKEMLEELNTGIRTVKATRESDIFSLGLAIYIILFGYTPRYFTCEMREKMKHIVALSDPIQRIETFCYPIPDPQTRALVHAMLDGDPKKRPDISKVCRILKLRCAALSSRSGSAPCSNTFAKLSKVNTCFFSYLQDSEASCLARCEYFLYVRSLRIMKERKGMAPLWKAISINRAQFEMIADWINTDIVPSMSLGESQCRRVKELTSPLAFAHTPDVEKFDIDTTYVLVQKAVKVNIYVLIKKMGIASKTKTFYLSYDLSDKKIVLVSYIFSSKVAREVERTDILASKYIYNEPAFLHLVGPSSGYTVSHWRPSGDLVAFINNNRTLTLKLKMQMAQDMAFPILQMHRDGLTHGDIKLDNYLAVMQDGLTARLIDFTTCRPAGDKKGKEIGTLAYLSPEACLEYRKQEASGELTLQSSCEADVYAFGLALYSLFTGTSPFNAKTKDEQMEWIISLSDPGKWSKTFCYRIPDPEVEWLVHRMLSYDPKKRPFMPEVYRRLKSRSAVL